MPLPLSQQQQGAERCDAGKLARNGFVTLAVNASCQGESGGEPRYIEDRAARMEDIRSAIDYWVTLPYVDSDRIGALEHLRRKRLCGERCDGRTPHQGGRNGGRSQYRRIYRGGDADAVIEMLGRVGRQRTDEAQGAEPLIVLRVTEDNRNAENIDLHVGIFLFACCPCNRGAYLYSPFPCFRSPVYSVVSRSDGPDSHTLFFMDMLSSRQNMIYLRAMTKTLKSDSVK